MKRILRPTSCVTSAFGGCKGVGASVLDLHEILPVRERRRPRSRMMKGLAKKSSLWKGYGLQTGYEPKVSESTVRIRTTSDSFNLRLGENDALEHVKPRMVFIHDLQGRIDS